MLRCFLSVFVGNVQRGPIERAVLGAQLIFFSLLLIK